MGNVQAGILGETATERARRLKKPGSEYGITRGARGAWQVNLKRQGHHFCRFFYDGVYGDSEAALAEARAYRDALMTAFAPQTNAEAATLRSKKKGGASGIHEVRDRSGKVVGYRATLFAEGQRKQRLFSIVKYGAEEALRLAKAQREEWQAAALVHFIVQNAEALRLATEVFPLRLTAVDILPDGEEDIAEHLRAIDAEFDARRPQFFTVSVRPNKGQKLLLRVSTGGYPSWAEQMETSYRRTSLADALQRLKVRAAVYLREFFGEQRSAQFLRDHGSRFNDEGLDEAKGFEIRERP